MTQVFSTCASFLFFLVQIEENQLISPEICEFLTFFCVSPLGMTQPDASRGKQSKKKSAKLDHVELRLHHRACSISQSLERKSFLSLDEGRFDLENQKALKFSISLHSTFPFRSALCARLCSCEALFSYGRLTFLISCFVYLFLPYELRFSIVDGLFVFICKVKMLLRFQLWLRSRRSLNFSFSLPDSPEKASPSGTKCPPPPAAGRTPPSWGRLVSGRESSVSTPCRRLYRRWSSSRDLSAWSQALDQHCKRETKGRP